MLALLGLCCFLLTLPQGIESSDKWSDVNNGTQNEVPVKITAKIGDNVTIPCLIEYQLIDFAWFLCHADCLSPDADWKIVVRIDNGSTTEISDEKKFGLDSNGSLVVKNINPENNNNWVRCFNQKRLVGMDHRSTIILIDLEAPSITMKGVKEYPVFEGMNLFLYCNAKGYPAPWIAWIWNDHVLQNSTEGPHNLLVRRVTTKEAGSYTCMALNSLGVANYTYQVIVKVDEPTRESKSTPATHSTDVTKEYVQGHSSLDAGIGIGIPIGIAIGIVMTLVCAYVYYRWKKLAIVRIDSFSTEEDSASVLGDDNDNDGAYDNGGDGDVKIAM